MGPRTLTRPDRLFANLPARLRQLPPASGAVLLLTLSLMGGWLSAKGIALQARSRFEQEIAPTKGFLEGLLRELGFKKTHLRDAWPPGESPGIWWDPAKARIWMVEGGEVEVYARMGTSGAAEKTGTPRHLGSGWKGVEALIEALRDNHPAVRARHMGARAGHPLQWSF